MTTGKNNTKKKVHTHTHKWKRPKCDERLLFSAWRRSWGKLTFQETGGNQPPPPPQPNEGPIWGRGGGGVVLCGYLEVDVPVVQSVCAAFVEEVDVLDEQAEERDDHLDRRARVTCNKNQRRGHHTACSPVLCRTPKRKHPPNPQKRGLIKSPA